MRRHLKAMGADLLPQHEAASLEAHPPTAHALPVVAFGAFALSLLAIAAFIWAPAPAVAAECPNEVRRQEQGVAALRLPDCRAYEIATPGSQPTANGGASPHAAQTSPDGTGLAYDSRYPGLGMTQSGHSYLARRGADGWSTAVAYPQEGPDASGVTTCPPRVYFSYDLGRNILEEDEHWIGNAPTKPFPPGYCGNVETELDPQELHGYRNVFVHDVATDAYDLVSTVPGGNPPGNAFFHGGSKDLTNLVFISEAKLTADSPVGTNLYAWSGGTTRLVTVLPDGTPVHGTLVSRNLSGRISEDGTRVAFEATGNLYLRINAEQAQSPILAGVCTDPNLACTIQVDKTQGPGASGGGFFEFANADASKVFFLSDHKLTTDSTAVAGKEDLYELDVETGDLTDLTVHAGEPADVWALSGWSADGSYLYFVAEAALAPGALPGNCLHDQPGSTCSLYLYHEGDIRFVAAVSVRDIEKLAKASPSSNSLDDLMVHHDKVGIFGIFNTPPKAEASPDGRFFLFPTNMPLAGGGGNGVDFFLYDAQDEGTSCLTCDDLGETDGQLHEDIFMIGSNSVYADWRKNLVLDDGRVFFDSRTDLVSADANGTTDVYEWSDGAAHLLSPGTAPANAAFVEASPDGSTVFFATTEGILANDTDAAYTIYAARVDGGFPEPPPLPGCEGEACRGQGTSSGAAAAAGTAAFKGPGNPAVKHLADCGPISKRAQRLSRAARRLQRSANKADSPAEAGRLRQRSKKLAAKAKTLSAKARDCRRANRRAAR